MMFVWSVGASMLIGAYILSLQEPNTGVKILGSVLALLVGAFGGLGYTAAEVYLDYCAEWMATIQPDSTTNLQAEDVSHEEKDTKDKEDAEKQPVTNRRASTAQAEAAKKEIEHK
jgi:hypothetical protein